MKVFGVINEKAMIPAILPEDCDNRLYLGKSTYVQKDGTPVALMRSKSNTPARWCILTKFSSMFFLTEREALDYCEKRHYKLIHGSRKHR